MVPAHPFDPTAPAVSADVPVIVGTDLHDSAFTARNYDLDEAGLLEQAKTLFGEGAGKVVAAYRAADPRSTPFKLLARMSTDRGMRRNAIQLAERKAALGRAPAYTAAERATMIFDTNTRVEKAPDQSLLALVEQYAVAPQAPRS